MEVFPTSTNSSTYGRRSSQIPHFYISEAYERTLAGSDAQRCSAGNGRNWEAGPTHSIAKMKTWWFKQLNCINIYKKTINMFEILGLVYGFAQKIFKLYYHLTLCHTSQWDNDSRLPI